MKTKFTFNFLIGLLLLATTTIHAQFQWAFNLNGGGIYEKGKRIVTDASGNAYTAGEFGGNMDFDPGPGTFTLAGGITSCFLQKVDPTGNFLWAIKYGGYSVEGISRDASGNLLLCGLFSGIADFDPGPGTFTLAAINGSSLPNTYALKLDPNGNFLWAVRYGDSNTSSKDISNDASGNVFITGGYANVQDFDPSVGTFTMGATNNVSSYVLKLDASGNFVLAKDIRNVSIGTACASLGIEIDGLGNIITTGYFNGTTDFDPSAASYTLSSTTFAYYSIFVQKLDASGNFLWAKAVGGSSVTNLAYDVAIDASNNVYTTGSFGNTADFDPGAGVTNLTATGTSDAYVWKLDANGNFLWAKGMGTNPWALCLDAVGDVYSIAYASTGDDVDPGAGTYTVTGSYLQKLDASGNFVWARGYGVFPSFNDISVNGNDVYFTGRYTSTVDFDPDAPVYNLIGSMAGYNLFVSKLASYPGSSTSIAEIAKTNISYKVYPNPAKNILTILPENSYSGNVNLFDYQGKLIYSEKFNESFQIPLNLGKYNSGIYFLKLNDISTKIVIEN